MRLSAGLCLCFPAAAMAHLQWWRTFITPWLPPPTRHCLCSCQGGRGRHAGQVPAPGGGHVPGGDGHQGASREGQPNVVQQLRRGAPVLPTKHKASTAAHCRHSSPASTFAPMPLLLNAAAAVGGGRARGFGGDHPLGLAES